MFKPCLPQILIFLIMCVFIDPDVKHAKFDSPVHSLLPCVVIEIAYKSRRDSGFRLLHMCVRHITGIKHYPRRISDIKMIMLDVNKNNKMALEWSSDMPVSMKDQCYRCKTTVTSCGKLHCCDCACKVGSNGNGVKIGNKKENLNNYSVTNKDKNMTCAHFLPNFMKLSLLLFDF